MGNMLSSHRNVFIFTQRMHNLNPILDASSKHTYRSFLAKTQTTPSAKEKLSTKYHHLTIDWKRVYLLSFCTPLETKLREFQFKILNRIAFMNEKLFHFDMAESDKCASANLRLNLFIYFF